ncbi:MAG: hypothetical protein ACI8O8_000373 [Oleiphilaceae bacterium]|jgi:hypothetical protein
MFGFPFFTSLIVVLSGVVVVSLLVNKGLAKRSTEKVATLKASNEAHTSQ